MLKCARRPSNIQYNQTVSKRINAVIGIAFLFLPLLASAHEYVGKRPSVRSIRTDAEQRNQEETVKIGTFGSSTQQFFKSDSFGVSIRFPKDWTVEPLMERNGQISPVALFLSPLSGSGDTTQENINLLVENIADSPLSADAYAEEAVAHEKEAFPGFVLLSSEDTLAAHELAHDIVFETAFQDQPLTFEQLWIFHNRKIYVWTLASSPDTFDQYKQIFHDMIETTNFY